VGEKNTTDQANVPSRAATPISVNNFCAIGIIANTDNPEEIFTDIKWEYPVAAFNNMVCPQGGNWFSESAKDDTGPLETLRRELGEELSFDNPADYGELVGLLGVDNPPPEIKIPKIRHVTHSDKEKLAEIVTALQELARPFGDFYSHTPKSVLDTADPKNERGDMSAVVSAWVISLPPKLWKSLVTLQYKFGNLSNESRSVILSLDRMIDSRIRAAFGHDRILQRFWIDMGFPKARRLTLVEGIEHRQIGAPRERWTEYLLDFNPAKRPPGF